MTSLGKQEGVGNAWNHTHTIYYHGSPSLALQKVVTINYVEIKAWPL